MAEPILYTITRTTTETFGCLAVNPAEARQLLEEGKVNPIGNNQSVNVQPLPPQQQQVQRPMIPTIPGRQPAQSSGQA